MLKKILCLFGIPIFLSAAELEFQPFSAVFGFENVLIAVPKNCELRAEQGEHELICPDKKAVFSALKIDIGCFESARIFVDLGGDEPRGLKARFSDDSVVDSRVPFESGLIFVDFTPVSLLEPQLNAVLCDKGIALSIVSQNADFVRFLAKNSKIVDK